MTEKEAMVKRISALEFAAWELHLFLDTHPNNTAAAAKLEEYQDRAKQLRAEYREKYGPMGLLSTEADRRAWIADPWPWEPDFGEKEEK